MQILDDSSFKKQIKEAPAGGYLFFGAEDYLKNYSIRLASDTLCPDKTFAPFNEIKLDAVDFTPEKLIDAMLPFPMNAERKLIIIDGIDFNSYRGGELEALVSTLGALSEYDYNTVIFNCKAGGIDEGKSPKKLSSALNSLSSVLTLVRFDKCTPQRLIGWVEKHFLHEGVRAGRETIEFLINYCGTGMYKLSGETQKLSAYVLADGRGEVTTDDVRLVSSAETEYDTFALANSIMEGKSREALDILGYLKFKRVDPILISGEIFRVFCDLLMVKRLCEDGLSPEAIFAGRYMKSEYAAKLYSRAAKNISYEALKRKIGLCTDADRQIKTSVGDYSALEMLVCAD